MNDKFFENRLIELSDSSDKNYMFNFTNFLNMDEISTLIDIKNKGLLTYYELFGGYNNAERCIARFANPEDLGWSEDYPIAILKITPLSKKFAEDLSHRDFLGCLMNLGIKREVIGDILIHEKEAILFCLSNMANHICENLSKIKHTNVKVTVIEELPSEFSMNFTECTDIISSERLDAIVAKFAKLSRNQALSLISGRKIYVNGKAIESNSYKIKKDDIISVRGYGKLIYRGVISETKKDRLRILYERYS